MGALQGGFGWGLSPQNDFLWTEEGALCKGKPCWSEGENMHW
jgi:hypothetical protein